MARERGFMSVLRFDGYMPVAVESVQSGEDFRTADRIDSRIHSGNGVPSLNVTSLIFRKFIKNRIDPSFLGGTKSTGEFRADF